MDIEAGDAAFHHHVEQFGFGEKLLGHVQGQRLGIAGGQRLGCLENAPEKNHDLRQRKCWSQFDIVFWLMCWIPFVTVEC